MKRYLILLFSIVSIFKCTNTSSDYEEPNTYYPLYAGFIRQTLNLSDSSYSIMCIAGTVRRDDGKEVFIREFTYHGGVKDSLFTFYRDGIIYNTQLNASSNPNDSLNPFKEIGYAAVSPTDGLTWQYDPIDSSKGFYRASFIGNVTTCLGTFSNVFAFEQYDNNNILRIKNLYAENLGLIGIINIQSGSIETVTVYIKTDIKEYGKLIPITDYSWSKNTFRHPGE